MAGSEPEMAFAQGTDGLVHPALPAVRAGRVSGVTRFLLAAFAFGVPIDAMPMPGLSSSAPLFGALLVLAVLWNAVTRGQLRSPSRALLFITVYTGWATLTLVWARELEPAVERWSTFVQLLASVWLCWQLMEEERDVRAVMYGYLVGCLLVIASAWHSFVTGVTYVEQNPAYQGLDLVDEGRYAALGFDPNDMGVTLAIGIPMAVFLALNALEGKNGKLRWLWLAYPPLALSGIALSGSRGSALTAGVACLFALWWVGRRSVVAAATAGATGVVGALFVVHAIPETWDRILTVRQQLAGGTMGERTPIWLSGLEVFLRHPILGVGVGEFPHEVVRYLGYEIVAHNTFLSVTTEGGIVGALLFFGAFVCVVLSVLRCDERWRGLVVALVVTWMIGVSSLTWEARKTTWLVLLLCSAVAALPSARRSRPGSTSPAAAA
jgi:hypothetical protein